MRCITCQAISAKIICKACQDNLLTSSFYKRELEKDFFVYSFYKIDEVKELLNTKYEFYGDKVFNILASLSFKKFAKNFEFTNKVYAIPIDDHTRHQFSQTAILTKHLKSKNIKPIYNRLKATNIVKYAGKDLKFRQNNKRKFIYKGDKNIQVILVDDLVTTGTTILEAKKILEDNGCEVLFALVISDVSI
ncbi:MAG: ComF family protein [Campylobacterota bacterium]|nr:ComF family protein [Campylobacterota bacterium]